MLQLGALKSSTLEPLQTGGSEAVGFRDHYQDEKDDIHSEFNSIQEYEMEEFRS